jgi:hypothetical protein
MGRAAASGADMKTTVLVWLLHLGTNMIQPNQIKANMPVVCSENGQFAVVDHMQGKDSIKLTRDKEGQHHYIPLSWVKSVDDKVHVDRTGDQAMRDWSKVPPTS